MHIAKSLQQNLMLCCSWEALKTFFSVAPASISDSPRFFFAFRLLLAACFCEACAEGGVPSVFLDRFAVGVFCDGGSLSDFCLLCGLTGVLGACVSGTEAPGGFSPLASNQVSGSRLLFLGTSMPCSSSCSFWCSSFAGPSSNFVSSHFVTSLFACSHFVSTAIVSARLGLGTSAWSISLDSRFSSVLVPNKSSVIPSSISSNSLHSASNSSSNLSHAGSWTSLSRSEGLIPSWDTSRYKLHTHPKTLQNALCKPTAITRQADNLLKPASKTQEPGSGTKSQQKKKFI